MDSPEPYLTRLTLKLLEGIEKLPADLCQRHTRFILDSQRPDGGWPGREGGSDLYYTGFALRSLAVMQALQPEVCARTAGFLREKMATSTGVVDFFSLLISCYLTSLGGGTDILAGSPPDWKERVCAMLEGFRTRDGGYGKNPGAVSGSTYTSFLVTLTLQLLDRPVPNPDALVQFVRSRKRDDGGYVEIAPMKRSGTNPTAAGVGVLQILNALTDEDRRSVSAFLKQLPTSAEGGFRANDRIPVADLLSTFTGSWTVEELGSRSQLDLAALRDYAEECELPSGGFRGGLWDEGHDVEYTFYGLGVLALTVDAPPSDRGFGRAKRG